MIICDKCIQAIRSRGETVVIDNTFDSYAIAEDGLKCEWCEEDAELHTELYLVHFTSNEAIDQDTLLNKLSELVEDLGFDYDRMSSSGQDTYTKICSIMAQLNE